VPQPLEGTNMPSEPVAAYLADQVPDIMFHVRYRCRRMVV
jgi:hypothetical protein